MIVVAADEGTGLDTMRGIKVVGSVVASWVVIAAVCVARTMVCEENYKGTVSCTELHYRWL